MTRGSSRGSVTIFVIALIVPVFFVLLALMVDVNVHSGHTQRLQQLADDSVLYAAKHLPYRSRAERAAHRYLSLIGSPVDEVYATASADDVSLEVSARSPLLFATFFGLDSFLSTKIYSKARLTPVDAMILIDRSRHSAPAFSVSGSQAWEGDGGWDVASLLEEREVTWRGTAVAPRIATQHCFNPVFAALKQAAIAILDHLSASPMNRVGVGFFPGGVGAVSVIRPMEPGPKKPGIRESAFMDQRLVVDGSGVRYLDDEIAVPETLVSEAECAAIAEQDFNERFRLPPLHTSLGIQEECGAMVDTEEWKLNSAYEPCLRSREVIWSRPARAEEEGSSSASFRELYGNLLRSRPLEERRGLVNRAAAIGVILSTDLPREGSTVFSRHDEERRVRSALSEVFAEIRGSLSDRGVPALSLYYVILESPEGSVTLSDVEDLQGFFDEQSSLDGLPDGRLTATVIRTADPAVITSTVVSSIILTRRSSVISRGL